MKECKNCGTEFKPNTSRQEYCSKDCKKKFNYWMESGYDSIDRVRWGATYKSDHHLYLKEDFNGLY